MAEHQQSKTGRFQRWRERRRQAKAEGARRADGLNKRTRPPDSSVPIAGENRGFRGGGPTPSGG
jgi:hypothetical protein